MADLPHAPAPPSAAAAGAASDAWGFNCGPAALCAVTGLPPDEVRRHFGAAWPGYTNPTTMRSAARSAGLRVVETYRGDAPDVAIPAPRDGVLRLVRIQWGGSWCQPGVPMAARYRASHWVADTGADGGHHVYDVNASPVGGWLSVELWSEVLVPQLVAGIRRADGSWWPTHVWEVSRG